MPVPLPPPVGTYRDRTPRLILFGSLNLLLAVGWIGLAVFYLLVPLSGLLPEQAGLRVDLRTSGAAAATYLIVAAVFAWTGWGALRQRRWVRAAMRILGWTWLLCGLATLPLVWVMLSLLLEGPSALGEGLPPELLQFVRGFVLAVVAVGGVFLPLVYLWAFRDDDVLETCRRRHPTPDWSDGCPDTVLGLGLGIAVAGLLMIPTALQPAVPVFGRVVTGWAGALVTLLLAAACLALVRPILRLVQTGWWGALTLLVTVGASCVITFGLGGLTSVLLDLGYEEFQVASLPRSAHVLATWGSALITAGSVAYLLAIRRCFAGPDASPATTERTGDRLDDGAI